MNLIITTVQVKIKVLICHDHCYKTDCFCLAHTTWYIAKKCCDFTLNGLRS